MQNLKDEAETFSQLRQLLCGSPEKRVIMMDPEWAEPKVNDTERASFYALFRKIGAKGVHYDGYCSFRLPVWSVGLAGGGDYKGYSYRPQPHWLGSVVEGTLDQVDREGAEKVFVSRRLDGGWFLYLQHWP